MKYTIKAHPTKYNGVQYRSRLEARWAAFFDLADWKHEYEPIDLPGWSPDFRVEFTCGHSECNGSHVLLAEVKPYYSIREFEGHPCRNYDFGYDNTALKIDTNLRLLPISERIVIQRRLMQENQIPANASAAFGINPGVSYWAMGHGSGGGDECVEHWVPEWPELWKEAGNITQWRPRR